MKKILIIPNGYGATRRIWLTSSHPHMRERRKKEDTGAGKAVSHRYLKEYMIKINKRALTTDFYFLKAHNKK